MSHIVVERGEGSFADRFRGYKVFIDGQYRGTIRQKEKWAFAVQAGTHTVSFRIDFYHSPPVRVAVVNRTRLVCRSSVAHAFGLLALFSPGTWITVREEDETTPIDAHFTGEVALATTKRPPRNFFASPSAARLAKRAREPAYRLAGPKTDDLTQARHLLELDLREAVATHAFDVKYEPQVDLRTQRVAGFEVLLHWRHPVRGLVSPAVFVPIAEELGLMGAIGQTVLEQACAEAATWPQDVGLSVNVTQRQLADAALPAIVAAALKTAGLDPSRLELEVAESVVMEHGAAAASAFQALRRTGVRIGIDGFGVAYSAHSFIPDAIFDKIKISRSVINGLANAPDRMGIVRAAIGLCTSLGMTCCAVGTETQDELQMLVGEGCEQAQGRVFGPPLTAREIPGVLARINGADTGSARANPPPQSAVSFFQVVESASDVVIITTADLDAPGPVIIYVNPAFTRLTGYTPAEAIGLTPRALHGPGTSRATLDNIRKALSEGRTVREKIMNFGKNGAPYWVDLRIVPMRAADGTITHFAAIQRDITMDKRRQDEVEYLSDRNTLTGILNGVALTRAVEAEIAKVLQGADTIGAGAGPCVVYLGIDGFGDLNEEMGDAVGNAILLGMADRLADNVRRSDTLCHISREIFAVCMPSVSLIDAESIVTNLCRAVDATPFMTPAGPIAPALSVGVVALTTGESAASLIHRADETHAAKRKRSTRLMAQAAE